jgi:hypothetical protein
LSINSLRSGFGTELDGGWVISFVSGQGSGRYGVQRGYGSGGRIAVAGPPGGAAETNPWKLAALIEESDGAVGSNGAVIDQTGDQTVSA